MNALVSGRVLVLLLLPSLLLSASAAARQAEGEEQGQATGTTTPVLTVLGVKGAPQLISADGSRSELTGESVLSLGDAIETDATARAALSVARGAETSEDQRDVLLVGPGSRVELTASDAGAGEAPVLVVVGQGVVRAVNRVADQRAMDLKTGERIVHLNGADTLLEYDAATDTAQHLVDRGSITIEEGHRRVLLKEDMVRRIEQGRVMGATSMDQKQWRDLAETTAVEGVEVEPKRVAADSPAPGGLSTASSSKPQEPVAEDYMYVRIQTTEGDIDLRLDRARAPITVENFMSYVENGFYAGTIFHRVMDGFMIQGGGFDQNLTQKPTDPPIRNEWQNGLKNENGTIAMARLGNQPDSATAQFFINLKDNSFLDQPRDGAGYAVFGKVVGGMDVVDKIRQVKTHAATPAHTDVPVEPVVIESVEVISEEQVRE